MSQRYRLTFEFVLRNPSDYKEFRRKLNAAITTVVEGGIGILGDYLAIEKVEADHDNS